MSREQFPGPPLYRYDIPGGPVLYFREELTPEMWAEWQRAFAAGELVQVEHDGLLAKVEV